MSKRKIQTNETWEEFSHACRYGGTLFGPCSHHERMVTECVSHETCPRVKRSEKKQPSEPPLWHQDTETGYEAYLKDHDDGFRALEQDTKWQEEMVASIPGLNVIATIHKARAGYWRSQRGWQNKRKKRNRTIDWRATYDNACRMEINQVFSGGETLHENSHRESLILKIKKRGNSLLKAGVITPKTVLDRLEDDKNTSYGNLNILYKTGSISHLEWVVDMLEQLYKEKRREVMVSAGEAVVV